ncbi:uroporphyrinogen decarboxylase family protein [bacterium]|nr:uroporphyrinogen decarboxylase family protein [bacterium]
MTSRDRILTSFAHEEPDRVPAWCGSSPEFWEKSRQALGLDDEGLRLRFGDDFRRVYARYTGPDFTLSSGAAYRSPFGVERNGIGYGQPLSHPLYNATIAEIHDYPWPDPTWMDVSEIRTETEQYHGEYAILGGDWSPFWHDAIDLMGMENLYYLMYDEPEKVDAVMTHLVDYYFDVSRRIFDAAGDAIDIFFIGNDLGSQTGPLLGEAQFKRFILPHIKRLIDLGHGYGLKVMLHCCGGFAPLIPSMIDAGLDGLHAVQPCCHGMDLRTLKAAFGDKILFNGCIDSQHVLIEGNPEYVRRKTREVIDIMKPSGGFVAGASHDYILEETPLENVLAMFDTIREYGVYS